MKKLLSLLLLSATLVAHAQSLRLDVGLECESYILCEAVDLTLKISNFGQTPFIADDYGDYKNNAVTIVLRHEADGFQEQTREGMPFGPVMVTPQKAQLFSCSLADWFPLMRQGKYTVQVFVNRNGEHLSSKLLSFSIVKGLEILTETHMLPDSDTRARRYTLLYWPRKQREDLFLRVEESPSDNVVALFRLGTVLRYFQPRIEFDTTGKVRITHQIARDRYVRTLLQSDESRLEVIEQKQLVDPNQAVLEQSVLESRKKDLEGGSPVEFRRRNRPEPDAQPK